MKLALLAAGALAAFALSTPAAQADDVTPSTADSSPVAVAADVAPAAMPCAPHVNCPPPPCTAKTCPNYSTRVRSAATLCAPHVYCPPVPPCTKGCPNYRTVR